MPQVRWSAILGHSALADISDRPGNKRASMSICEPRAAKLDESIFNAYIEFISQAAISAAGPSGGLRGLNNKPITKEGCNDFTQLITSGDGERFLKNSGKILGIELIITDNNLATTIRH